MVDEVKGEDDRYGELYGFVENEVEIDGGVGGGRRGMEKLVNILSGFCCKAP